MTFLLMDMGNSRCKSAITSANKVSWVEQFTWLNLEFDSRHWLSELTIIKESVEELEQILVSSVASDEQKELISQWCRQVFAIDPIFFHSQTRYNSSNRVLRNSYEEPLALGVDRWLAMVGAMERTEQAFAVLDAGTAITLDLVDANGKHLGGHIVPGVRLMQKALFGDTGKIAFGAKLDPSQTDGRQWLGENSMQAVELGTYQAALGYLKSCLERLDEHYSIQQIFVCGGDGAQMMQQIELPKSMKWLNCPDLVLEGLFYQYKNG